MTRASRRAHAAWGPSFAGLLLWASACGWAAPDPFKEPPAEVPPPPGDEAPSLDDAAPRSVAEAMQALRPEPPPLSVEDARRLAWLEENVVRVASIDPANHDFSDLEPLAEAIGDSRVVFLGEQSHGDGSCFLAKARLIAFLHQRMGFDVLVFESGMFDCREVHRALAAGEETLLGAFDRGVFGIWTRSAQVEPLLRYVRGTYDDGAPLEVAGYDSQFTAADAEAALRWPEAVRAYFAAADHPVAAQADAFAADASEWLSDYVGRQARLEAAPRQMTGLRAIAAAADEAMPALIAAHGPLEAAFMRRTIDDAVGTHASNIVFADNPSGTGQARGLTNARDKRMAENLVWLANDYFRGRKLIVWAATFHGVHDIRTIRPEAQSRLYEVLVVAGGPSKQSLGDDLYTIGFEAHQGEAGRVWMPVSPVPPSPAGSLGDLLSRTDHPFLFLDFRRLPAEHWLRTPVVARVLGYAPATAVWPEQMDALFFTRDMMPSRTDEANPANLTLTVPLPAPTAEPPPP